jgi:hypothetical protein
MIKPESWPKFFTDTFGRGDKVPKPTPEEAKRRKEEHEANAELTRERAEAVRLSGCKASSFSQKPEAISFRLMSPWFNLEGCSP